MYIIWLNYLNMTVAAAAPVLSFKLHFYIFCLVW